MFRQSKGFVIGFNKEGIEDFRQHEQYAFLFPLFEKLQEPTANAFVMNVLSSQPVTGAELDETLKLEENSKVSKSCLPTCAVIVLL